MRHLCHNLASMDRKIVFKKARLTNSVPTCVSGCVSVCRLQDTLHL